MKTGLDRDTPTKTLLSETNDMSVHQTIAYHTLLSVFKILESHKPTYLYNRFHKITKNNERTRRNSLNLNIEADLTLTRGGFLYRGSKLYNMLPSELKSISKYQLFKLKVKAWIKLNVSIKA